MNGLALCAGQGGLELGLKLAIGESYRTICWVERNHSAARILIARQRDGIFEPAPIWDDMDSFNAHEWLGIDIVTAGWPCQGSSTAPRGRQCHPELWPSVLRIIETSEPRLVFLENVRSAPWNLVESSLRDIGYYTTSDVFCPSALGAPHRRPRRYLLAYADKEGEPRSSIHAKVASIRAVSRYEPTPRANPLGMDDGPPGRMVRLQRIGEGVVPSVVAIAFTELIERISRGSLRERGRLGVA